MNLKRIASSTTLRVIVWLLAFVLPSVALAQDATDTPDGGLPRNESGQILFVREGLLTVINGDGSNQQMLIDLGSSANRAEWTHDGNHIMFSQGDGIYRAQADGSDITMIFERDEQDSYTQRLNVSPDDSHVLWVVSSAGVTVAYVINVATSEAIMPFDETVSLYMPILWSPDSTQLLFTTRQQELYLFDLNSNEQHKVGAGSIAAWSPDGARLALPRDLPDFQAQIDLVSLDGTIEETLVTFDGLVEALHWSPDGQYLAYEARHNSSRGGEPPAALHVIDLESRENRIVSPSYMREDMTQFQWSYDSQRILISYNPLQELPSLYVLYPHEQRIQQIVEWEQYGQVDVRWRP